MGGSFRQLPYPPAVTATDTIRSLFIKLQLAEIAAYQPRSWPAQPAGLDTAKSQQTINKQLGFRLRFSGFT